VVEVDASFFLNKAEGWRVPESFHSFPANTCVHPIKLYCDRLPNNLTSRVMTRKYLRVVPVLDGTPQSVVPALAKPLASKRNERAFNSSLHSFLSNTDEHCE